MELEISMNILNRSLNKIMAGHFKCKIHGEQKNKFVSKRVVEFFLKDEAIKIKKYKLDVESIVTTFYSDEKTATEIGFITNDYIKSSFSLEQVDERQFIEIICSKCLDDFIHKYNN